MDGWTIGLAVAMAAALLLLVPLVLVVRAGARTADKAQEVLAALEEVQGHLAGLEELGEAVGRSAAGSERVPDPAHARENGR